MLAAGHTRLCLTYRAELFIVLLTWNIWVLQAILAMPRTITLFPGVVATINPAEQTNNTDSRWSEAPPLRQREVPARQELETLYPAHPWPQPVHKLWCSPESPLCQVTPQLSYRQSLMEEDLEQLFAENLAVDLALWANHRKLSMELFEQEAKVEFAGQRSTARTIMIRNNKVYILFQPSGITDSCERPCNHVMRSLINNLVQFTQVTEMPDVVMLVNVRDTAVCRDGERPCTVPVLSPIKEWYQSKEKDILIPYPVDGEHALYFFPWESKLAKAVFRGVAKWCHSAGMPQTKLLCSRMHLANMTQAYIAEHKTLDSGIGTFPLDVGAVATEGDVQGRGYIPLPDLSRFKLLLNLDGITASSRFSKLLLSNSVVLKQHSRWIEHFSRSLIPTVHYIPFWQYHEEDVIGIVESLLDLKRTSDDYLASIAMEAQKFAVKYTSPRARMLYWRRALKEYKSLFDNMDAYIANIKV